MWVGIQLCDMWKFHHEIKDKLKNEMHKFHNQIRLSSDCCTTCNQRGYICLRKHFVDNNWRLNGKILVLCKIKCLNAWLNGELIGKYFPLMIVCNKFWVNN